VADQPFPVSSHDDGVTVQIVRLLKDFYGRVAKNDVYRSYSSYRFWVILELTSGEFTQPVFYSLDERLLFFFL
jgi:hypothetical protein